MEFFVRILITAFMLLLTLSAKAADFYVITSTHKSQAEAQQKAAEKGGWVLITDFYENLTPNTFAVVRGPFRTRKEADDERNSLKQSKDYSQAYTKDAGEIDLNGISKLKNVSPQIVAAILGEIQISSEEKRGGSNPCEEQEVFSDFSLSYYTIERATYKAKRIDLDIGNTSQVKSTGAISRMRICTE